MDGDARKLSVKAYFDGIAAKDMSRVPWAQTVGIGTGGLAKTSSQSFCDTRVNTRITSMFLMIGPP